MGFFFKIDELVKMTHNGNSFFWLVTSLGELMNSQIEETRLNNLQEQFVVEMITNRTLRSVVLKESSLFWHYKKNRLIKADERELRTFVLVRIDDKNSRPIRSNRVEQFRSDSYLLLQLSDQGVTN